LKPRIVFQVGQIDMVVPSCNGGRIVRDASEYSRLRVLPLHMHAMLQVRLF
jgi:hypothetical protein